MKRHLIGIGGVGMSALATALLRLGDEVTGADRNLATDNIRFLTGLGIRCFPDDGSGVDAKTDEIIVSTAIEADNPALAKAKELGIPVTHRAKALARALAGRKLVAVVGTCGKSTVTAMLGHVLAECGLDPLCVNGANVPGWEGAVRFGAGQFAVAEVDESDKSLVAFRPYAAIVTNASADHYSKEEMDAVFDAFVKDIPGPVVDGREKAGGEEKVGGESRWTEEVEVSMPGRHNRQNAALALRMALALGCNEQEARAALLNFKGVHRRLQRIMAEGVRREARDASGPKDERREARDASGPKDARQETRDARVETKDERFKSTALQPSTSNLQPSSNTATAVFDDYAHNPEKLHAMWTTLADEYPKGICVVWRPHGYAPLRKMMDALAAMFNETIRPQDKLLLLPVYDAGGTTDRSVNSGSLAAKLKPGLCELVADHEAAYAWIAANAARFGAFATAGARDPDLPALAARLAALATRLAALATRLATRLAAPLAARLADPLPPSSSEI